MRPQNIGASNLREKCKANVLSCPTLQTIYVDDLLEFVTFNKAVLKMDIEGFETHAMQKASMLFKEKYIPYIFMEFLIVKRDCNKKGIPKKKHALRPKCSNFSRSETTELSTPRTTESLILGTADPGLMILFGSKMVRKSRHCCHK